MFVVVTTFFALGAEAQMFSLWFWVSIWILVAYIGLSITTLGPAELAAVYLFNKRWRIIKGGVYFLPLLIFSVKRFSTNTHRQMSPGKKEDIVRDDSAPLGPGQVRAVRIIHASAENAHYWIPDRSWKSGDPKIPERPLILRHHDRLLKKELKGRSPEEDALESSITTEIIAFTDFNLSCEKKDDGSLDESLFDFVENVGSIEKAGRRLDGAVRGALQELLAPLTARHATEVKAHIEQLIKDKLELLVAEKPTLSGKLAEKPWGMNIAAFQIEEINPGKTVNSARADEAASVSFKAKAIREGEALAKVTRVNAEADAFKEEALGTAKASAFAKMAEVMKTPEGQFAAQLETAGQALKGSTYTVLPDVAGIIGSLAKVVEGVKK